MQKVPGVDLFSSVFSRPWVSQLLHIIILIFLSSIGVYLCFDGDNLILSIPLTYVRDGLFTLSGVKRIIESSSFFTSSDLGAPFGFTLYDFPIFEIGQLIILKFLAIISNDASTVINMFIIVSYPVNAFISYMVFTKFKMDRVCCVAGAIVYAFLPLFLMRLGQTFYLWSVSPPLTVLFSLRIFYNPEILFHNNKTYIPKFIYVLGLLIIGCFGIYGSAFAILTFTSTALLSYCKFKSKQSLWAGIMFTLIVVCVNGLCLTPYTINVLRNGRNEAAISRASQDTETYGLKIVQLLLPHPDHKITSFARLNQQYSATHPLVNENYSTSLGILGGIGFFYLLYYLIFKDTNHSFNPYMFLFSRMVIVWTLYATIGGFSSLFSLFFPYIRSVNRICIFIAFVSISALMLLVDEYTKRTFSKARPVFLPFICAIILLVGFYDQSISNNPLRNYHKYLNDKRFVQQIESMAKNRIMVYQLPYVAFPEAPQPTPDMTDYDHFRLYLHSKKVSWSYGSMKGRLGDRFFRKLSFLPLQRQIEIVKALGFGGIYVNRNGFIDKGVDIETSLTRILGKMADVVSEDGSMVYFSLDVDNITVSNPSELAFGLLSRIKVDHNYSFAAEGDGCFLFDIGWSDQEKFGRWTNAEKAFLRGNLKDIPNTPLRLRLVGHGYPEIRGETQKIIVKINEVQVASWQVPETRCELDAVIPPEMLPAPARYAVDNFNLSLEISRPTKPKDRGENNDTRTLGFFLQEMIIQSF